MSHGMMMFAVAFFISGVLQGIAESAIISVFWQVPQYTILTAGELLLLATGMDYASTQSPPTMKTFMMAVYWTTLRVGSLFSGLLYKTVFKGLTLEYVSYVYAVLMLLNFGLFLCAMAESVHELMQQVEDHELMQQVEDHELMLQVEDRESILEVGGHKASEE